MDSPTALKIASTVGIISTTTFWSMNLTINHLTFPTLLLGGLPKSSTSPASLSSRFFVPSTDESQVSKAFLNRQWQEMYWRGYSWGPLSGLLSAAAFMTAAYLADPESRQRYLYATASAAAVSVIPWTLAVMVPTNNELHRRGDAQRLAADKEQVEESVGDGRDIMDLIRTWLVYNNVRASLAVSATLAGVLASMQ
ncbi:hypothetical protein NLU13_2881 [Sarocladium strictum]|uniref:DUF1772-domain-containing protein n=1 Tax=Sarocladium strictum TaxID=5046 RepID=A0AA39GLP7_SARSR|nr:hypothetical protein NLU13_2881 [Sarocladium strictum]